MLGIPLTTHIYRTCINQVFIDTAYVLGLWPRLRPVPNTKGGLVFSSKEEGIKLLLNCPFANENKTA
jgi:hypothetical protein